MPRPPAIWPAILPAILPLRERRPAARSAAGLEV